MRFRVKGSSMEPTFHEGDELLASRILYLVTSPKVNDVVIVKDPRTSRLLLKRITRIKGDSYFVAGDNPASSTDSRTFGVIPKEKLIGKVLFRYRRSK